MIGKSKSTGRARLYAPFILAFFVFFAVIGAEYLIIQSLIDRYHQGEIAMYHEAMSIIIDNIDRYEIETGSSISRESHRLIASMNPAAMNNSLIQIIHDSIDYTDFLERKFTGGLSVIPLGFENTIIETSVGKTRNGEIVVLESHEYMNMAIKDLEKIAAGLIIVLIAMIIITVVPGSLLIESLARRSFMMNSLAPASVSGVKDKDVLLAGMQNSSEVAFLITSPAGIILSASPSCTELLEIGKNHQGLPFTSLTVLPAEVRKKNPSSFWRASRKSVTIQSMNSSRKDCLMEVHPFYREEKVVSVLFLFIPLLTGEFPQISEPAVSGDVPDSVSSRAKTHLVKSLIHDMNNHISGIIGVASVEIETSSAYGVRNPFNSILDSAEKIAALCSDLQTTVTGGKNRQLRDLLQEMGLIAEVLRKILPERVEIEVTGSCSAWIKADGEFLREFFYGLALNSTAIMNGEGRIRIDVSEKIPISGNSVGAFFPGDKVCIRYSDGFIMPVALRDILSNRNYSVSDVERQYGATIGNGYKALNKLDGSIVFERGSGETILCLLLDGYEPTVVGGDGCSVPSRSSDTPGLSILVADDVDIVLSSVSEYLENSGMVVTRAKDGNRVMELLREGSFDAAVLDLNMPGVPTPGIVRYCQTSKPEMAVVITSGFDAPQGVRDLIIAPSTDYLHKPHNPEALIEMIFSLIGRLKEGI
ncbi:MAG: response regulator [Candidatus Sabulitectum sp.]|nr:response regulator [Candidatus Sabulitectum sp.]